MLSRLKKAELFEIVNKINDVEANLILVEENITADRIRERIRNTLRSRPDIHLQIHGLVLSGVRTQSALSTPEPGTPIEEDWEPEGFNFNMADPELVTRLQKELDALKTRVAQQDTLLEQRQTQGGGGGNANCQHSLRFLKEARQRSLSFSATAKENAREFLRKVVKLKKFLNIEDRDMLLAFPELLNEGAERWFLAQPAFENWRELKSSFEQAFVPRQQDASLMHKIVNRRQEADERPNLFISTIKLLNSRLETPLPDVFLLKVIQGNLLPVYQEKLVCMDSMDTIAELEQTCLELETGILSAKNFRPTDPALLADPDAGLPGRTATPANKQIISSGQKVSAIDDEEISNMQVTAVTSGCFNCYKEGHFWNKCTAPLKLFCKWCGKRDVKTNDCCRKRMVRQPAGSSSSSSAATGTSGVSREELQKMIQDAVVEAMKQLKN